MQKLHLRLAYHKLLIHLQQYLLQILAEQL